MRRWSSGNKFGPGRLSLTTGMVLLVAVLIGFGLESGDVSSAQQVATPIKVGRSGLPIPRFVSLKSDRVNVRGGPSKSHAITWVFSRQGLPVEIIAEFDNWRQIRDSEGEEGWIFHGLLSGRRTALVAPWSRDGVITLRAGPEEGAKPIARLEPGVLGRIEACDGSWCRLAFGDVDGWLPQEKLWGAYMGETID